MKTTPQIDYGINLFDNNGGLSYDSGQKMLMPRMFAAVTGAFTSHTYQYWEIANYATFLSDYSVTRPAFSVAGGFRVRDTYSIGLGIYCTNYLHSVFALHSQGLVSCIPHVGHSVRDGNNYDSCQPTSPPLHPQGDINSVQYFLMYVIDADRYV